MSGSRSLPAGYLAHRHTAVWLLTCCVMVAVMVLLGGLTRLTHSGLSMVEWEPIRGIIPPLNEADWQLFFQKYRESPEFKLVNRDMDLAGFKGIFWLEYIHRVWGRLIGMVFLIPFLWLAFTGRVGRAMVPRLIGIFLLGAAQGGMGWIMVASGLVDNPAVSHYRLAAHLGLAFLIHAWMFWVSLDIIASLAPPPVKVGAEAASGRSWMTALLILSSVTLLFGALVAGLRAGLVFNTWPLMDGQLIPNGLFATGLHELFEDHMTVQFAHRTLAEATVVLAVWVWWRIRTSLGSSTPVAVHLTMIMCVIQAGLGIATLILGVPIALASAHQMGAMVVVTLALWAIHGLHRRA